MIVSNKCKYHKVRTGWYHLGMETKFITVGTSKYVNIDLCIDSTWKCWTWKILTRDWHFKKTKKKNKKKGKWNKNGEFARVDYEDLLSLKPVKSWWPPSVSFSLSLRSLALSRLMWRNRSNQLLAYGSFDKERVIILFDMDLESYRTDIYTWSIVLNNGKQKYELLFYKVIITAIWARNII